MKATTIINGDAWPWVAVRLSKADRVVAYPAGPAPAMHVPVSGKPTLQHAIKKWRDGGVVLCALAGSGAVRHALIPATRAKVTKSKAPLFSLRVLKTS